VDGRPRQTGMGWPIIKLWLILMWAAEYEQKTQ